MHDKRVQWIYTLIDTLVSVVRLIQYSRFKRTQLIHKKHDKCVLLANGPSLSAIMQNYEKTISGYDVIAVNQMAITDEFEKYRPNAYILADPAYWYEEGNEEGFAFTDKLFEALIKKTTWNLQLYLPYQANIRKVTDQLHKNSNIKLVFYNKTTFYGIKKLAYFIYNRQWGMIRPQTVVNPALMLLIYSKYKTIHLVGADSDWMKNFWVDERNRLRINDRHYYYEEEENDVIIPFNMGEQCLSFYYVFSNYLEIESYSKYKKVKIYNASPLSFIDAFEKITIKS